MKTAIWWIRRDLCLADNVALEAARAAAENVVPVFLLDPGLMGSRYNGEKRTAFLLGGLRALDRSLRAWCEGRTGYPVVDAGMRQLSSTGFMHNRACMVTAAFLTKHLLIDWRRGEEWFMKHLVDGDPAANNGGWQWSAGTGTDAAPYFRIFNSTLQGKRFDPERAYVSRFVPELEGTKPSEIHEPRNPIVSHTQARIRALAAFQASRNKE